MNPRYVADSLGVEAGSPAEGSGSSPIPETIHLRTAAVLPGGLTTKPLDDSEPLQDDHRIVGQLETRIAKPARTFSM